MNIDQAVTRACEEQTLLDALNWICVWESERAIKQAREQYGSGADGAGWDTCFKHCLDRVMVEYQQRIDCKLKADARKFTLEIAREALTIWSDARLSRQGRLAITLIDEELRNG